MASFLKMLYSRHDNVTAISRSSHMVGPSKNTSNVVSRTDARMHANEDIWEIRQIAIGKGTRVAKEATMGMMMTRGPAATAATELVATTAATSQAMRKTRVAMTTGLVTMMGLVTTMGLVMTMGLVTMMGLVTTRMRISLRVRMAWNIMRTSDFWGRRIG